MNQEAGNKFSKFKTNETFLMILKILISRFRYCPQDRCRGHITEILSVW